MDDLPISSNDRIFLNNLAMSNAAPSVIDGARLAQLLSVVSQQQESLQSEILSLETFHRQLDIISSARRRIPPELWSAIFKDYMFIDFNAANPSNPRNLMLTCRTWLDVVLSTPELWSHIYLRFRPDDGDCASALLSLRRQLRLSSTYSLLVYINSWIDDLHSSKWAVPALDLVLKQSGSRIQSLVFHVKDHGLRPLMPAMTTIVSNLSSLEVWNSPVEEGMIGHYRQVFADLFPQMRHLNFWGPTGMWPMESLKQLHSLRTDDISLATASLKEDASTIERLYLQCYANTSVVNDHEPLPVNRAVRYLDLDCRSHGVLNFITISRLYALEHLTIRNCDKKAWKELGPVLKTLLEGSKLVSLSFEIHLGQRGGADKHLRAAFCGSLPSLRSLRIIEYYSEDDDEYGPDLCPFPLSMLHHNYNEPTLPSLENLRYRINPNRFSSAYPRGGDRKFVDFLCELEELLRNRIDVWPLRARKKPELERRAVSLLKLIAVEGGYKHMEDFPSFERRLREYEKDGLELYFSAMISSGYKDW